VKGKFISNNFEYMIRQVTKSIMLIGWPYNSA